MALSTMFSSLIRKFSRQALARQVRRPEALVFKKPQKLVPSEAQIGLHVRSFHLRLPQSPNWKSQKYPAFPTLQIFSTFQARQTHKGARPDLLNPQEEPQIFSDLRYSAVGSNGPGCFHPVKYHFALIVAFVLGANITIKLWTEDCDAEGEGDCQTSRCTSHDTGHYLGRLPPCLN